MILAANFKMNHTRATTKEYLAKLKECEKPEGLELFVFPPFTALDRYESVATIGAQNAYGAESGSFTGEIGLQQLQEFGITTLILGHSERRHLMGESQELISQKFKFYKERGFTIFYCIGETLDIREKGDIQSYLQSQLEGIDLKYEGLIVAYEPVWAIGTGRTAKEEEIEEVLGFLSTLTPRPLLYGGSVKPENVQNIMRIPNCSGALVGTASWRVESFCEMIEKIKEL